MLLHGVNKFLARFKYSLVRNNEIDKKKEQNGLEIICLIKQKRIKRPY
jgi:hypothetical protein